MRIDLRRAAALLAGLWAGVILCIAAIGAPASFAIVPRDIAGQVAGQMFAREAYLSLGAALMLLMAIRRRTRGDVEVGKGSVMSANMLLVLGALFCTVLGYFALQPMMAAAKMGQGALSFGALHGISAVFFVLKGLLILALAWRLSAA
jgi:hypothetical protein